MERQRLNNPRRNYYLAKPFKYIGSYKYRNAYGYSKDTGKLGQAVFDDYFFNKYKKRLTDFTKVDRHPYDFRDEGSNVRYEVKYFSGLPRRSLTTSGRQNNELIGGLGKYIGVVHSKGDEYDIYEADPELNHE